MSEHMKQKVDTNSAEFKQGFEAGLDSEKDRRDLKGGNELELKEEAETKEPTPLFLSDSPEGNKGNAQDEKDETEE